MLTMSARDRKRKAAEERTEALLMSSGTLLSISSRLEAGDGPEQISFTVTSCALPKADLPRGEPFERGDAPEASVRSQWDDSRG